MIALGRHPWTIGGGGAAELKERLDALGSPLTRRADSIGITAFTLEDDVFVPDPSPLRRLGVTTTRLMCLGDALRDWTSRPNTEAIWPYDAALSLRLLDDPETHFMWPFRTGLASNKMFGSKTKVEAGLRGTSTDG